MHDGLDLDTVRNFGTALLILVPFAAMGTAAAIAAWVLFRRGRSPSERTGAKAVPLRNPFSLTEAAKFGAFFAGILLVVKIVQGRFPGQGLYMIAGLAGLTDVDAITLSMAEYAKTGDPLVASNAIVLATLANTAVKTGIVTSLGDAALSRPVLIAAGAIVATGFAAIALS
jgi:uncharacterized membrane protein (DUF4010 family)